MRLNAGPYQLKFDWVKRLAVCQVQMVQWVETNQSNFRIYPKDIRTSHLLVLRCSH